MCVLCEAKFAEKDALFEHLNNAHPDAKPVSFIPSQKGKAKLAFNGYMYCLNYSTGFNHSWRCELRGCRGKAYTQGQTYDDVASILTNFTEHNKHAGSDARVVRARVLHQLCADVVDSDEPPLSIYQRLLASVDQDAAAIMPSRQDLSRLIQRKRESKAGKKVKVTAKSDQLKAEVPSKGQSDEKSSTSAASASSSVELAEKSDNRALKPDKFGKQFD